MVICKKNLKPLEIVASRGAHTQAEKGVFTVECLASNFENFWAVEKMTLASKKTGDGH